MAKPTRAEPRIFYVNETHELAHVAKEGRGRLPKYASVDWQARGAALAKSISGLKDALHSTADPLREKHYFVLAVPAPSVVKISENKKTPGEHAKPVDFRGEHSRIFQRLGLELIDVTPQGAAVVHAAPDKLSRLEVTARQLDAEGPREQARWITLDHFSPVPADMRADPRWLATLPNDGVAEVLVELQPLLSRAEAQDMLQAIARIAREAGGALTTVGQDFSGRHWIRGRLTRTAIVRLAREFFSIQSIHPPIRSLAAAVARAAVRRPPSVATPKPDLAKLPCVAIVDSGVPANHVELAPYRRGGYVDPISPVPVAGNHGSMVASRVVFGEVDHSAGPTPTPVGACSFYDVMVGEGGQYVHDKGITSAIDAVLGTAPDVRVFNMSIGRYEALGSLDAVEQRESLALIENLDNQIFARDILVVVSAGNSRPGIKPSPPYPDHVNDPAWALGSWALGFNTLVCGAYVDRPGPGGVVRTAGWPSPLTRIGPGLAQSPVPGFAAPGGDVTNAYAHHAHLGVWCCTADGVWEDQSGTSLAAPLLAREAALVLHDLTSVSAPNSRPFAATAKAVLALSARLPAKPPARLRELFERTLGRGRATSDVLRRPSSDSAIFVWQTLLARPGDTARVQIPVPLDWLREASAPRVRIVWAWDTPASQAASGIWGCRYVNVQLKPVADGAAYRPKHSTRRGNYPLCERTYDLSERVRNRCTDPTSTARLGYAAVAASSAGSGTVIGPIGSSSSFGLSAARVARQRFGASSM